MTEQPSKDSRAIFIAEIEQFGGAERSVLALSRWLYERGLANHVVTYFDHCNLAQYANHPLAVIALKPAAGVRKKVAALREHFTADPADFKPLLNGYQEALHFTLAGVRGFHNLMHDTPALFGDRDVRSVAQRLRLAVSSKIVSYGLKTGGATIVTSEFLRDDCRREFNIAASIVRMGGLADPGTFRLRRVTHELRMLSVCRIEENKRIDWILQSLGDLECTERPLSARVDWQLDLAGKGSLIEPLRVLAANLGINERVHFHGFVSDGELDRLYADAHLFLMPAVQGYGIPAIEALQRGIPTLLHRESGVSDILQETPWATILQGEKPAMTAALASALEGVLTGRHHPAPLPNLPTEDEWAEQVATLCHWA